MVAQSILISIILFYHAYIYAGIEKNNKNWFPDSYLPLTSIELLTLYKYTITILSITNIDF